MDRVTNFSMEWTNIQFKAKDIILFCGYIIAGVFFITKITNAVERQGEKITEVQAQIIEMKDEGKGTNKDFQVFINSIQNQINATNTQVRLLEQRLDILESDLKRR